MLLSFCCRFVFFCFVQSATEKLQFGLKLFSKLPSINILTVMPAVTSFVDKLYLLLACFLLLLLLMMILMHLLSVIHHLCLGLLFL